MATCNVDTLLVNGRDFRKLSDRDLKIVTCQLACELVAGGGGGGGNTTCGVGPPVAVPASGCGLYINTSDGSLFMYYSGAWH